MTRAGEANKTRSGERVYRPPRRRRGSAKSRRHRSVQRVRVLIKQAVAEAVRRSREFRMDLRARRVLRAERRLSRLETDVVRRWSWIVSALLRLGAASEGNLVKLFCDGDEKLEELWNAIDHARRRIWFEVYIFEPDPVGVRTLEALTNAAQRGCEVKLLYDGLGSPRLTDAMLAPLRQAGGVVESFNPLWRWRRRVSLLRRDHRKIIIIDDDSAFCGGMNISVDYAGKKHGNRRFHDCHLRLHGPCVRDLAAVFVNSWRVHNRARLLLPRRSERVGETFVQVLASRGSHGRRTIQRSLRIAIRNAVRHCYITTPYFVPPLRLIRAINYAATRGVDVRILTAGKCDVPIVAVAARHIYGLLLKHNVRIFEMYGSILHAKTITMDGLFSTVGSFNLDTWSDLRNLEVNVGMLDPSVARQVYDQFMRNLESANEVTLAEWGKRPWWQRLVNWAAYQVLRL